MSFVQKTPFLFFLFFFSTFTRFLFSLQQVSIVLLKLITNKIFLWKYSINNQKFIKIVYYFLIGTVI